MTHAACRWVGEARRFQVASLTRGRTPRPAPYRQAHSRAHDLTVNGPLRPDCRGDR